MNIVLPLKIEVRAKGTSHYTLEHIDRQLEIVPEENRQEREFLQKLRAELLAAQDQ